MTTKLANFLIFILFFCSFEMVSAQLQLPQPSPSASVKQTVGITDISIDYSSPGVKGRTIWGGLEAYDEIWRAGANAATKITFSTDVSVDGNSVPAGTYSVFAIPGKTEWTMILNKKQNANEGNYDKAEDVARVTVKSQEAPFKERLAYYIEQVEEDEARVSLHWEKVMVSFNVDINTSEMVMKALDAEIAQKNNFWVTLAQGAQYALNGAGDEEKAFNLIAQSIEMEKNFYNHMIKARMLEHIGKKKEAIATAKEALKLGDANPTNAYTNFWKSQIEGDLKKWQ